MASVAELIQFLSSEFASLSDITDDIGSGYSNFTSISNGFTPAFFSEDDPVEKRIQSLLAKLATFEEECDDPDIWDEMAKINVSGRQLCILLWFPIEWALTDCDPSSLKTGALAACAYIRLASIKGSRIQRIFDHQLYKKCLHLFRALYNLHCSMQGSAKLSSNSDFNKKKQGGFAHSVDEVSAASFDMSEIVELLFRITETLFVLFRKEALDAYTGISHVTALLVRDFARIDICAGAKAGFVDDLRDFKKLERFIDRSFALMHYLISSEHSTGGYIVITRIIYPRLAFWTFDCDVIPSSTAIPTVFTTWRDLMVEFIKVRTSVGDTRELMTFFNVLDNLYQRCTDRLDYRTRVAQSVLKVLQVLPRVFHYEFVRRIDRFSRDQKMSVRNFSIEIAPLILMHLDLSDPYTHFHEEFDKYMGVADSHHASHSDSRDELQEREEKSNSFSKDAINRGVPCNENDTEDRTEPAENSAKLLLEPVRVMPILYECIIRCCLDKASSVRIRAMHHLASLLGVSEHRQHLCHHAKTVLERFPKFLGDGIGPTSDSQEDEVKCCEQMSSEDPQIITKDAMLHVIVTNVGDDTVGVRKNAANALRVYFPYLNDTTDIENSVECFKELCFDCSSVVRKQAIEVVDFLYNNCTQHRDLLENAWLDTVLTMINDRETNLQNVISQLITETLLTPILDGTNKSWKLLHAIASDNNKRRLLTCALLQQHRKGLLNPKIIESLNLQLEACPEQSNVVWMLLAELSAMMEVNPLEALPTWYTLDKNNEDSRVRYITRVLSNGSRRINDDSKKILVADLKEIMMKFSVHTSHISSVYHCLAVMMDAIGEEGTGSSALAEFGHLVLDTCYTKIKESLLNFESFDKDTEEMAAHEKTLIRMVLTMGVVVQFSSNLMRTRLDLFDVLKSVLAFDIQEADSRVSSSDPSPASSRAHSASFPFMSYGNEQSSPQPITEDTTTANRFVFTPTVRACAVLTIGKFCLLDERIAKATIPVFIKQLRLSSNHVIRNNILIAIGDLCTRYTSTVDRYSAVIAACLKDRSTLIRQQCLESLTSLINERFIKWEGEVMYQFLSTILDEDRRISDYAKFCLLDILLPQYPDLFVSHFIECLMHFNAVSIDHDREAQDSDHSQKSCMHGSVDNRMIIYRFMLSTFDDTRKLTLMSQICTQVFCPLMNGKLKYENKNVQALVKDALTVMSLSEMKLNADLGTDPNEEEDPPAAVIAVAKEIITKAFRTAMLEYVMPTLLDLRIYLTERRSELRRELYDILRAICRDHKDHVDLFLGGDEQLKAEVEFEMRKMKTDRANSYGCLNIHRPKYSAQ